MKMRKLPSISKVNRHADFISLLNRYARSPKKRKHLLEIAAPGDIDACSEIFLNFLQGNIDVPHECLLKLQKRKKQIRKLANRRTSRREKKVILGTQTGGFLPLLLPKIVPLLASAVGSLLN
jgi:hypothetical protein